MNKLDKGFDEDQDENTLDFARHFKKKLRFDVGETVFLISDKKREVPMTVSKIEILYNEYDYACTYVHPKKKIIVSDCFIDKILIK